MKNTHITKNLIDESETSDAHLIKMHLRFANDDLDEVLYLIEKAKENLRKARFDPEKFETTLDIAKDQIEDVYDEIDLD